MDLQDFKRWHWMAIGLVVGALWAASRLFYGLEVDGRSKTFDNFEHDLLATKEMPVPRGPDEGNTCIVQITVHPPIADETPDGLYISSTQPSARPMMQWVTGMQYHDRIIRDPKMWFIVKGHEITTTPFVFKAPVPYSPPSREDYVATKDAIAFRPPAYRLPPTVKGYVKGAARTSYPSIRDYLDELQRRYGADAVRYRYAWWESREVTMAIYPLGGLLLIGGVWPTLLGLMLGAGWGGKRKKETFDLSRYKGTSTAGVTKPAVTDQDMAQVAAMAAAMEKDLAASAGTKGGPAPVAEETVVRTLSGEKLDATKVADAPKAAAKTFGAEGGNYYPTEIHGKSKEG